MKNILAPSILSADFTKLSEELKAISDAGAKYVHIDVMDGSFVPSISFGMPVIKSIRKATDKVFDVHLMIDAPERYLEDFKEAGADIITVHAEATNHLDRTLEAIKALGLKAAVAINPATPLSAIEYVYEKCDMILIMSVNPGFGGQKYISYCTDKIKALRQELTKRGLDTDIEVDGGVNLENVKEILDAGANVIVAGSAIFKNPLDNAKKFMEILSKKNF